MIDSVRDMGKPEGEADLLEGTPTRFPMNGSPTSFSIDRHMWFPSSASTGRTPGLSILPAHRSDRL